VSHFTETGFWQVAKPYESDNSSLGTAPANPADQNGVEALRAALIYHNAWPEAGDLFLQLLAEAQGYGVTLVPTDFDWLPKVAEAACNGEDIGSNYPSIFQKLLTYSDLRKKFLQTLKMRSVEV